MLTRNAVYELLNQIMIELNHYLKQVSWKRFSTEAEFEKLKKEHADDNWNYLRDEKNINNIFVIDNVGRNSMLLAERVKNMLEARQTILAAMNNLKNKDNDDEKACAQTLYDIKKVLEQTRMQNTFLNSNYKKNHLSYQQNREIGRNPISSFFHTTWFQSRANKALEKAFNLLINFEERMPVIADNTMRVR